MKTYILQQPIQVKLSSVHGYGVFAKAAIKKDSVIEECYAILTPCDDPYLCDYYFSTGEKYAILTGYGFIYNHSDEPNAQWKYDAENRVVVIRACRNIKAGEEIFTNYGKEWFDCRQIPIVKPSGWSKAWRYFKGWPLRALIVVGVIQVLLFLFR